MFLPRARCTGRHRLQPSRHRAPAILALAVSIAAATVAFGSLATAATAASPTGHLDRVHALSGNRLALSGWAVAPGSPARSIWVDVYVNGKPVGRFLANRPRADVNRSLHVRGRHGFSIQIARPKAANEVSVYGLTPTAGGRLRGTVYLIHRPNPIGPRIIAEARKYLGVPYVSGGSSPAGFDCSGYVAWVYQHANVARLSHSAETQRHQVRLISRSAARPGDLIFYMAGGQAYHDAIYAGGSSQYVAPAPGQLVKLETIWSSAIQFGTRRY